MIYVSGVMFDYVKNNRKDIKYKVFYISRVLSDYVRKNRTTRSHTVIIVFL